MNTHHFFLGGSYSKVPILQLSTVKPTVWKCLARTAMAASLAERLLGWLASKTSRSRLWHRWSFFVALPVIIGHRVNMCRDNLTDMETAPPHVLPPEGFDVRGMRTADGSCNDLAQPWMGMAEVRFGRNMPIADVFGERPPGLFEPSPRLISNEPLARREFMPVPHLNLLAAAWIQFMVHDWLSHGSNEEAANPHHVPPPPDDTWPEPSSGVCEARRDRREG
jgi:hypothetical protein